MRGTQAGVTVIAVFPVSWSLKVQRPLGVCRLRAAGGQVGVGRARGPHGGGHGAWTAEGRGGHQGQGGDNRRKGVLQVCQFAASWGDQHEPVETVVWPLVPQVGEQLPHYLPWWRECARMRDKAKGAGGGGPARRTPPRGDPGHHCSLSLLA